MSVTNIEIARRLRELGCDVKENEPMRIHTTFRIGGSVDMLVSVNNVEQLKAVLAIAAEEKINLRVIGNGSNLLVSDEGLRGIAVKLDGDFCKVELSGDKTVRAGAGASLSAFCKAALDASLTGLEFAWGIPGSVGGAAYMNAGAYGGEMKDVVTKCEYITYDGECGELDNAQCGFDYRTSVFQNKKLIVTAVTVQLAEGDAAVIKEQMDDIFGRRKSKQPLEMPSAGSVFKRPVGHFAGGLIEQCGLKGYAVGGAMVSEKHAGFIVNSGDATCSDVLALVKHIQDTVKKETGVDLECEIKAISD